ncbi:DUF5825 family protein [Cryptosporangium sp. NPDC051539]|uniref:DUF5825 family protein n=1 Tax=Cryptosporangium sp. NPDC051539 TaxID=3363962 RepID=UPI0037AA6B72
MSVLTQNLPPHPVTGTLTIRGRLALGGTVRITDGVTPRETLTAIRLLREAAGLAAAVEWSLETTDAVPLWQLAHLPPPRHAVGLTPDALERWRSNYRYALCYYRRGPGFVVLRDERRGENTPLTIADAATVTALEALRDPRPIASLDAAQRGVLPELVDRGLVLRCGDAGLALPWRPSAWPVPCTL